MIEKIKGCPPVLRVALSFGRDLRSAESGVGTEQREALDYRMDLPSKRPSSDF
jgi:hypothetical protein